MSEYHLENFTAKKIDQIEHKIRVTYKLYSLRGDGSVLNCLGTNESIDRLMEKNEKWLHRGDSYVIRKIIIENHEEPVFKVKTPKRTKRR